MGDQKGSALALACEILAGVLTGSGVSGDQPFRNGMLSIYLSPQHFGATQFAAQAIDFADHVRAAAPAAEGASLDAAGRASVKVPGDLERDLAEDQMANGIELAAGTWDELVLTATRVGVEVPTV